MASYPGTGVPEDPGFTCPGRFERKIWRISVVPIPSRISTPNRLTQRRYTSAGKASPAETHSLNEKRAKRSPPACNSRMDADRVGKTKNRVGRDPSTTWDTHSPPGRPG